VGTVTLVEVAAKCRSRAVRISAAVGSGVSRTAGSLYAVSPAYDLITFAGFAGIMAGVVEDQSGTLAGSTPITPGSVTLVERPGGYDIAVCASRVGAREVGDDVMWHVV
jgi:hypothetical protein